MGFIEAGKRAGGGARNSIVILVASLPQPLTKLRLPYKTINVTLFGLATASIRTVSLV
jgi:hypothetical protein